MMNVTFIINLAQISLYFPIKIKNRKDQDENKEFSVVFNENIKDVIKQVHGNYMKKDDLIKEIVSK